MFISSFDSSIYEIDNDFESANTDWYFVEGLWANEVKTAKSWLDLEEITISRK